VQKRLNAPVDPRFRAVGLRVAGAGLLAASAAIHLDLYVTGYRSIPTIGWLFLLQVIVGFVLAAGVLVTGFWLAAAAGAVFALSTLGGYLLSVWVGLFGFTEVRTTPGIAAGVIDVAAFAVLAVLAASAARRQGVLAALPTGLRGILTGAGAGAGVAVVSVVALAVLGVGVAQAGTAPASAAAGTGAALKAGKAGGVTVVTDAKGLTLYSFAPDTPAKSNCSGSCAAYWPPVTGTPSAGPGVTGKLGTIKRSDGSTQATYNGHPLYTYVGDSGAGQASGNNLNLNGGLWREITPSG
jgi:predicted lipoprotein with Yx(FWY)xxD motif